MDLAALEERLGYRFTQSTLLEQAVTHRSHGAVHNERLEFLGDAVLNCTIAHLLFQKYGRLNEGDLSRLRANLVKQSSLAEIAERLELSEFLRLGEGEMKSGGFRRPSILADTMEAAFGAVFVDGGFDAARDVIGKLFEPILKSVDPKTLGKDSKTLLQEYLQGKRLPLPVYTVVETRGAAHNQEFEVECAIPKLEISVRGTGRSRRAAEQAAAKLALEQAQAAMQAARRSRRKPAEAAAGEGTATDGEASRPEPTKEAPTPKAEAAPSSRSGSAAAKNEAQGGHAGPTTKSEAMSGNRAESATKTEPASGNRTEPATKAEAPSGNRAEPAAKGEAAPGNRAEPAAVEQAAAVAAPTVKA